MWDNLKKLMEDNPESFDNMKEIPTFILHPVEWDQLLNSADKATYAVAGWVKVAKWAQPFIHHFMSTRNHNYKARNWIRRAKKLGKMMILRHPTNIFFYISESAGVDDGAFNRTIK